MQVKISIIRTMCCKNRTEDKISLKSCKCDKPAPKKGFAVI